VDAGGVVLKRDLTDNEGLGGRPPDGHRAMTIRVTQDSLTGLKIGYFVDVLLTYKDKEDPSRTISKLLIQNMQILAVNLDDREGDRSREPSGIVTVAVTPRDAERISWICNQGTLPRLAVRAPGDKARVTTPGFDGKAAE
jgi:Flp pilus assembly protein CpaB